MTSLKIYLGDCLDITSDFKSGSFDLIYIDPPFNTGKVQSRKRLKTVRDDQGDRTGFQGKRYKTQVLGESSFDDNFDDFITFIEPRLREAHRLLSPQGSFFFHIDYRESHYCKVMLDNIFGRESFKNEIVWAYDYGARSKKRWSAKHDNILWYAKDPSNYIYRYDDIDRIPYMAPGLVGPEKAAKGEDTDRCMVADNRESEWQGEDGISDTETYCYFEPHSSGFTQILATECSTSLPAAGRLVRQQSAQVGMLFWWTIARKQFES